MRSSVETLAQSSRTLGREIPSAFSFAASSREAITFFGGARVRETDPIYADAMAWGEAVTLMNFGALVGLDRLKKAIATGAFSRTASRAAVGAVLACSVGAQGASSIGRALSGSDISVTSRLLTAATTTGAGPGIMEAVPKGVRRTRQALEAIEPANTSALRAISVTQGSRIILDFEQETNQEVERVAHFAHFLPRRLALTERAAAFVTFPGGFGTLNELFEVMRAKRALVLHGSDFWGEAVDTLFTAWRTRGFVDDAQLAKYAVVDGPDAGLRHLLRAAEGDEPPLPTIEKGNEMAADAQRALKTLAKLPSAVTFIGSRRLTQDDRELSVAARISEELAQLGVPVRIGGDGALMGAVAKGVQRGDPRAEIQALLLDEGQLDRRKAAENCHVAAVVNSAPVHKLAIYENTAAIVALPGGIGTFDEVFEVACLMQTNKIPKRPLVLVGREFWKPIIDAFVNVMSTGGRALIGPDDPKLFQIVDDEAEAMAYLRSLGTGKNVSAA